MSKAKVRELWAKREELRAEKAYIEAKLKEIDSKLYEAIPPNEVIEGVRHVSSEKKTISYGKVSSALMGLITPKKKPVAERILEENTKVTVVNRLAVAKEDA